MYHNAFVSCLFHVWRTPWVGDAQDGTINDDSLEAVATAEDGSIVLAGSTYGEYTRYHGTLAWPWPNP